MKIGIFSDLHMDAVTAGVSRFVDVRDGLTDVVQQCIEREVDAAIFCGDLCNPDSGSIVIRVVHAVLLAARQLSQANIPNFWVAGNHDRVEDGTGRTMLSPIAAMGSLSRVVEQPECHLVKGVELMFFPYPSRVARYDPAHEAERMFAELGKTKHSVMAFGHLQLDGAQLGSETRDFARGADVQWPVATLKKLGAKAIVGGHYHKRQTVDGVMCVGSLDRLRFDEADNSPGWMLLEVAR
jgi:DNA repair exonuclease SbcCD nuclease subunit